jgi:hypothetical protein
MAHGQADSVSPRDKQDVTQNSGHDIETLQDVIGSRKGDNFQNIELYFGHGFGRDTILHRTSRRAKGDCYE